MLSAARNPVIPTTSRFFAALPFMQKYVTAFMILCTKAELIMKSGGKLAAATKGLHGEVAVAGARMGSALFTGG
jgi:hypothetical protein